jgi:hypothetical protein
MDFIKAIKKSLRLKSRDGVTDEPFEFAFLLVFSYELSEL